MSEEMEQLVSSSFKFRKILGQLLSEEVVNYLMDLVTRDLAHRNYLKIVEENENEECKEDVD